MSLTQQQYACRDKNYLINLPVVTILYMLTFNILSKSPWIILIM